MTRRDRQLLFALAGLALALASLTLVGIHSDVLLAAPVLVLALPLLAASLAVRPPPAHPRLTA